MTSSMPPSDAGPEYLEQGRGARLPRAAGGDGGGRRKALLGGAAVVGLGAIGAGVWAATSFFATGAQPDEALPPSTLVYAGIDLDPSGGQKIEAFRTLNKFPAIKDEIGVDAQDDVKRWLFTEAELAGACEGLDYGRHLEPWLGDRAAVALVDLGREEPAPVAVVQVTDAEAAADGLARLRGCGGGETFGWDIGDEWAVLAETDELAREVTAETGQGTLADDATYQELTEQTGDTGVLGVYVSPLTGDYLADHHDRFGFPFGLTGGAAGAGVDSSGEVSSFEEERGLPGEVVDRLRDFGGLAATLRFDDGAVELESVGDVAALWPTYYDTAAGDDVVASLPADTAAAFGVGLEDGWAQRLVDELSRSLGGAEGAEGMVRQAEQWTGLELPEDLETLLGDSTAVALGPDFDPEAFDEGGEVAVGVKVQGDPAAIERVLDKLRTRLGEPMSQPLQSRSSGDVVVVGPGEDYLARLLEDGGLGDTEAFQDVVTEAERAGVVAFVNFDAGDGWLTSLAEGDAEVRDNLEPLDAFGASSWQDGDTTHGLLRLTTD